MQADTVSKHFIASGVQLVADVLTCLLSSSWEMGDSFSPEETQDEGSSSSSEDTQWTSWRWSRSSMKSEIKRLQTFQLWPASVPVSPAELAAAGFYFVGPADTVQCFCCGGLLYNWVAEEDPMVEHKKFFPSCLYIQEKIVGNCPQVPWSEEHLDCVDGQFLGMLQSLNVEESPVGGQPEYPYMETEGDRLVSFENWPSYSPVSPELLARAGFFYTGQQDHVRCFYCDGTLRNWEQGDDPWIEHARWFPRCAFLLQSRGREFISHTQQSNVMLGEASEWLDNLYSKQAPELEDPHLFLLSLRERFEDPSIGLKAAGQIHKIKQAGRPALEYVREFRKIADRIEGWPEQCLLHHFIEGLDNHLAQACIYREVPDRLQEWYQTAVKLDVKLSRYKKPPSPEIEPKPERPRREPNPWRPPTTTSTDRPRPLVGPPLVCFWCGQGGHRAANCPVPYPRLQNRPEPAMRKKPAQRLTREKSNRLTQEPVAQITPPTQEDAGTPGGPAPALPFFDSDDEGENDPMEDNLHWSEDYSESSHESLEREPDPWRVRRETQAEHSHEPESTTSMEEKLRQLQEERMCKVCMDKDVSIVLVPCGHLVVCAECAPNLSRCPICRGDIRDSMKAFLS